MSKQREGKEHQWKPGPKGGKRSTVYGCPWPVCALRASAAQESGDGEGSRGVVSGEG